MGPAEDSSSSAGGGGAALANAGCLGLVEPLLPLLLAAAALAKNGDLVAGGDVGDCACVVSSCRRVRVRVVWS